MFLGLFATKDTSDWIMYPNPAKDHVTIEVKEGVLPKYVKIYDTNGRLVQKVFTEGRMIIRVELRLRSGSYIIYLEDKP